MRRRIRQTMRSSWKRTGVFVKRRRAKCAWTEKSTQCSYRVDTWSAVTSVHLHCVIVQCAVLSSEARSRCSSDEQCSWESCLRSMLVCVCDFSVLQNFSHFHFRFCTARQRITRAVITTIQLTNPLKGRDVNWLHLAIQV